MHITIRLSLLRYRVRSYDFNLRTTSLVLLLLATSARWSARVAASQRYWLPSTVEAFFATDRLSSGGGGAQPRNLQDVRQQPWIVNAVHIPLASSASAHGTQIPEGLSPAAKYEHGGDDDGADVFPCTVRRIPPPPCDGNANAYDKGTERKQRTHHRSKRPPPKHQPEIQTEKGGAVPGSDRTYPSRLTSRGLILPIRPRCDIVRQRLAAQARAHPGQRRTGQRGKR
mmetsp:Transcript_29549/g.59957  ORF Transcript_29549/g.59957 Transcript_29549/m.59957 type:complete len:227 (+) Transcript_29549:1285-1965(+)